MTSVNKISARGLIVWVTCAVFFGYEFLLRTVLGTFQHPISYDLQLSPISFAVLSTTAYLMVYGLMQVPVGIIVDRFGLKKSLIFAVVVCAISTVMFSFAYEFKIAVIARMLMGLGSSFGFVCLLVAVYEWMPQNRFGLFVGLSQFLGTLGPMIAAGPLNQYASAGDKDWRPIFWGLGVTGCAILIIIIAFVKNNLGQMGGFRIIQKPKPTMLNLSQLLSQKQVWIIALYSACVYFGLEYLSENEGKIFLQLNGYDSSFSSYMITVAWIGYAIGCPLLGGLSDYYKRRKVVMTLSALLALISLVTIIFFPISKPVLTVAFVVLGIGAGGQSIGFAMMAEQCSSAYLAAGLGVNNAMIAVVSSINAPLIGALIDMRSEGLAPVVLDYQFAFSLVVGLISIAFLVSVLFVKETYCRSTKGFTVIRQ